MLWVAAVGWMAVATAGCSGSGEPARVPLGGRVELAGSPVASGSISLMPEEGHSGPAVTAVIEDGRYQFDRRRGPVAGPHKLVVLLHQGNKASVMGRPASRPVPPGESTPKRWELQMEVPEREPFEYDVDLD